MYGRVGYACENAIFGMDDYGVYEVRAYCYCQCGEVFFLFYFWSWLRRGGLGYLSCFSVSTWKF